MKVENVDNYINEYKKFIRDIKIDSINNRQVISVSNPKKSIFSFLFKGNRKISEMMEMGGIIVGSNALKFYKCGGESLITRKCNDWDIIFDKKSFVNFCSKNSLYNMDYQNDIIRVNFKTGIFVGYKSYPSYPNEKNYIFNHQFDIISMDELPCFIEVGNFRISKLEYILEEKIKRIKEDIKKMNTFSSYESKHYLDCNEVMTKVKAYKNEKSLY